MEEDKELLSLDDKDLEEDQEDQDEGQDHTHTEIHPLEVTAPLYPQKRILWVSIVVMIMAILCGAMFGLGVVIGRYTNGSGSIEGSKVTNNWGANVTIGGHTLQILNWFDGEINADNVRSNLDILTKKPHIAGGEENHQLAELIYKQWEGFSFDKVELVNYSVLLSYPNTSSPNILQLKNSNGGLLYQAHTQQEPPKTDRENDTNVVPPFNAYSGSGTATGPLVYVNYARIEDFLYLTTNLSMDLSKHICISRYGGIFRGDKAHLAQRFNCSALLIYSDPQDSAPHGVPVYPNGPGLPPGGVQRGSLKIMPGDPLTPGIPSLAGMYRRPYSEALDDEIVPRIPVQPISYGDAVHFMRQLESFIPPSDWIGQLVGVTYRIMQNTNNTNVTYIEVNNYQEQKTIYNVIATIYGAVEPDRQVILGNHRDAWVFGAVDPSSATAVQMEIARSLSVLRQSSWRPGRTLILCNWDAEEPMLVGSTEWVEDKGKLLGANTVAYLNLDIAVQGTEFLKPNGNPLLYGALWKASEMVKCPDPGFDTVYDQWIHFTPKDYNGTKKPLVWDLGSGSDYAAFLQEQGISCLHMSYTNSTYYFVYHSVHDNFYWMSHFGDPDFSHHVAVGLVWIKTAMLLTTTPLLPYDPRHYALRVTEIYDSLVKQYGDTLKQQNISLKYLSSSVSEFSDGCVGLWEEVQRVNEENKLTENTVRIINDKFMNIERAFIHPEGLPGRPYYKHVIFAPSSVNSYGSSLFPGIADTIFTASQSGSVKDWNKVRRQIDIVRNHLRYATMIMNEPNLRL